jgi:cell division protein FtsZ
MLDEKLEDEVWITVVATGYSEPRPPRRDREERHDPWAEPAGEPRVLRTRERRSVADVDVPEFIPRY